MRTISLLIIIAILGFTISDAVEHEYRAKEIIPGEHRWTFSIKEVQDILVKHLRDKKEKVPQGKARLSVSESYRGKSDELILTIEESDQPTCN